MIFMDLETYSKADLSRVGGRNYAKDPTTEILCACWSVDGVYHLWVPHPCGKINAKVPYVLHTTRPNIPLDRPWVAHNGDEFDSLVWRAAGLPEPVKWVDTLPLARLAGYPGKLDELSQKFLGVGKDKVATRFLQNTSRNYEIKSGELAVIAAYNIDDVRALEVIYEAVKDYSDPGYETHRKINERGILFDRALAKDVLRLSAENNARAAARIESLTGGFLKQADLTKRNKVLAWCKSQGLVLESIAKDVIEALLDNQENDDEMG